ALGRWAQVQPGLTGPQPPVGGVENRHRTSPDRVASYVRTDPHGGPMPGPLGHRDSHNDTSRIEGPERPGFTDFQLQLAGANRLLECLDGCLGTGAKLVIWGVGQATNFDGETKPSGTFQDYTSPPLAVFLCRKVGG